MTRSGSLNRELTLATLIYVALIGYGTLFSSAAWRWPEYPAFLDWTPIARSSRADMLENVLGYVPLGVLLAFRLRMAVARTPAILLTTFFGFLLSLTMELLQVFVPGRVSSSVDLLLNTIGTFGGASAAIFIDPALGPSRALGSLRRELFVAGRIGNLGSMAVILWIAAQISPFVPTLDVSTVRQGLSPAWQTIQHPSMFSLSQSATYGCYLFGLGILWTLSCNSARGTLFRYAAFLVVVLAVKPFFAGRALSLEAFAALPACMPLVSLQRVFPQRHRALIGVVAVAAGFLIYELVPQGSSTQAFNWIPLRSEITNTLNGMTNALSLIWTFFMLGALVSIGVPAYRRREAAILGAALVAGLAGACEWAQQYIPGRSGDITTVALALAGWILPWRFVDVPAHLRTAEGSTARAR